MTTFLTTENLGLFKGLFLGKLYDSSCQHDPSPNVLRTDLGEFLVDAFNKGNVFQNDSGVVGYEAIIIPFLKLLTLVH